jgi:hypothetical protein
MLTRAFMMWPVSDSSQVRGTPFLLNSTNISVLADATTGILATTASNNTVYCRDKSTDNNNNNYSLRWFPPGLRTRIRIPIGSGFNRVSGFVSVFGSRSESRRAKMTHKSRKNLRNFMFCSAGFSFLRAEGFFCNLDVLYGGLGIGKL